MENQDTFTERDLRRLLQKKHRVMEKEDAARRKAFKEKQMKKEHDFRAKLNKMKEKDKKVCTIFIFKSFM